MTTSYKKKVEEMLKAYTRVCRGGARTRAIMFTQTFPQGEKELIIEQIRKTSFVIDIFEKDSKHLDTFMVSPGLTAKGRIHYHFLFIIKDTWRFFEITKMLSKEVGINFWSQNQCVSQEEIIEVCGYLLKNAKQVADKLLKERIKIKPNSLLHIYQPRTAIVPVPRVATLGDAQSTDQHERFAVRGAPHDGEDMNEEEYDSYWNIKKRRKIISIV